ncbi:filament-like plant protein 3 [Rutidosis leptorrhynchoides]|uniref:filament-like plant protein 3 n=1 Tax=Rutidosis leptorrhynchoides TaxID=125765 RepID=UPI003A9979E4
MDRRSWLWRRKSSEKSPGETESSGGSISSHSERFSDDQMYSNQSSLSPEVTSKVELSAEEFEGGDVKTLSEKLSAALMNISIKEDLVKQHSKVAEEAVEGWEKAETEVLTLRQKIEDLTRKNSTLEDRICQLDGALKECLRQLRQTREERDQEINEAISKKTSEWQITKTEYENRLADLNLQFQSAKKSESADNEKAAMKCELDSMAEELEMRFIEKELSNQAAEQASKLHLESAKKAAKFEAECRRLTAALTKALSANDRRSLTNDSKEANEVESNSTTPSKGINLMDDFLEMEKLAALPKNRLTESEKNRLFEVEELLKKVETDKMKVEITLNERENEIKVLRNELKDGERKLVKMEALLAESRDGRKKTEKELELTIAKVNSLQETVKRSELEVVELKSQLDIECNERKEAESRYEDAYVKKNEAESQLKILEAEVESLNLKVESLEIEVQNERGLSGKTGDKCRELEGDIKSLILKVDSLETEVEKERTLSKKMGAKSHDLEDEISRLQLENQYPKPSVHIPELKIKQDAELALAGSKFADCQKTIASLNRQLNTLATLEDFLIDPNEFSRRI